MPGDIILVLRDLKKYRKPAVIVLALLGCLVSGELIRMFVQPASAMDASATTSIDSLYGDETAYYCARYGQHNPSIPAVCQSPAMATVTLAVAQFPAMPASTRVSDCRSYDALFRQYSWNVPVAEAICQAESGGNPDAVSRTNDYGLMQLHDMRIFDPAQNVAAAYRKYQSQGWRAWTTYISGKYLHFL